VLVRECLRSAPVTVPPECTLEEAARLMGHHGVGSVLVISGDTFLGIATDRDITIRGLGAGLSSDTDIEAVMTEAPVTIQGSADIFEAFRTINEAGVRRLPVLEDDDLAGIITVDDLLVSLVLELGAVVSPLVRELAHSQVPPS
jgi:CBS domain-containing protein